jgi:cell surface protein SprA
LRKAFKYILFSGSVVALLSIVFGSSAGVSPVEFVTNLDKVILPLDTPPPDLPYPFPDNTGEAPLYYPDKGLMLESPSNIKTEVDYDPTLNQYNVTQKMGELDYRPPTYMDSQEYIDYQFDKSVKGYWRQRTGAESINQSRGIIPKLHVGGEVFDRIFGGNTVDIRPQGSAELIFGANISKTDNPQLPVKNRKISTFDFQEKIQLNVIGKIGDKLKLTTNYNTEAAFDFENQMKLEYTGYEDEIIKKIEAGNVSLPLTGSLITGSQSLFGIKTQLQFGRLTATTIFSQEKGKKSEVNVSGGAQTSRFEIVGDNYEANKHYFLSQYFHDNYNASLANLPVVTSSVNITKIEVWVGKTGQPNDVRNILAFTDLGETTNLSNPAVVVRPGQNYPTNYANDLYYQLDTVYFGTSPRSFNNATNILSTSPYKVVTDYEKFENAKKLSSSEYTFNPRLGFISLTSPLNYDEVLAVSYQYTVGNKVYQVGEFSTDGLTGDEPLFVKMLKSTNVSTKSPMWDLMMKNVYSIGAFQINPLNFKMEVYYYNNGVDINYIPEGTNINGRPLLQVLKLDKVDSQGDGSPDGVFDFIEGITINSSNGRIYFPLLEPFGQDLRNQFLPTEDAIAQKYYFPQLYDSTKSKAQQFPEKNRFKLKGSYQSASNSEISLNAFNIPKESVTVSAGGVPLQENVDYTVDYNLGRVKIINSGILESGTPIKISLESNSLFNIQSKSLMGTHLDYRVSKDFNIGGTVLNLTERPLTKKVNIGDEPISNTIWGLDMNYRTEAPFLTRWVDKLPLLQTKESSSLTFAGEFAELIPGHSKAIGKAGNSYIDDFEGSQSTIDIKSPSAWTIASVPQGQTATLFPEGELNNNLAYGYNRSKLAWYVIDPLFLRSTSGLTPGYLDNNVAMSNNQTREIMETELFPNKPSASGQPVNLPTFDLAYYPSERGPYNYVVNDTDFALAKGIHPNGNLKDPASRWAGIMRKIETNDFEAANVEFVQFWMMDPFNGDNTWNNGSKYKNAELYFNLGNVSEDILKDSRKSFENGLPLDAGNSTGVATDQTPWGKVPVVTSVVSAFDNLESSRPFQDVGLDGVRTEEERSFYQNYLTRLSAYPTAYQQALGDPSSDDYHYFRGDDYDNSGTSILDRYKKYNGMEGNSPTESQYKNLNHDGYPTSATISPNKEDINNDNTLSENEAYYQYKIKLNPTELNPANIGNNYIVDAFKGTGTTKDGNPVDAYWYQFKIPVKEFEEKIGNIEDFRSIRFIRMFFKNVDTNIVCRFARLELVRGDWRRYENNQNLISPDVYIVDESCDPTLDVSAVSIEESGSKTPVNYVLPPGIDQEQNAGSGNTLINLNEQSMALKVCGLPAGTARAVFKNTDLDVRSYKKLKMYVHAEATAAQAEPLRDGDLTVFIRLGTDYTDNYYEYEIPLKVTPAGNYNGSDVDQQNIVWPESNRLELEFKVLQRAKQERNTKLLGSPTLLTQEFVYGDGANKVRIKGNPNLSSIKTIMIGVRNPPASGLGCKCGEIWVNELRLSDFDESGGWAANARVTAKLADLGSVTLAGNMSTPGFGSIEKKVNERQKETIKAYDISSSLELGKFLPEETNIRVPMYIGYSESFTTPKYNPLDPDIEMKNILSSPDITKEEKVALKEETQDYTRRKSINFTNVKKEKGKNSQKSHIYDVENLSASYAYTQLLHHDVNIKKNEIINHRADLNYIYSTTPKLIKPFAKSKSLNSKYFSLIKDFNFYTMPNKFSFTTGVDRMYSETTNRNNTPGTLDIPTQYNKNFTMSRQYDLRYDLTKTLLLDFKAVNEARILEPDGKIDTEAERDSIKRSILGLGKTTHYRHMAGLSYGIPISKIPFLDFTNASVKYSATFDWDRGPFALDSLGHTIMNSNSWQWNTDLNMVTLYNKIPYFKKVNQKSIYKQPAANAKKTPPKTSNVAADTTKKETQYEVLEYLARLVMGVKKISLTFTDNSGTTLPGYGRSTQILGFDQNWQGPGIGFLSGKQDPNFPEEAASKGWLVKAQTLNLPYLSTNTKNFTGRANIEPFPDLRIEVTANRNVAKSNSEFFRWNPSINDYEAQSRIETGNFSMSFLSLRTAFKKEDQNHNSSVFQDFLNKRAVISQRLGDENKNSVGDSLGFAEGYGSTSQDVLIPAFLAAYSGKSENHISLNPFPTIPLPNWNITYDGLIKMEVIKKFFKTFTLRHAYRSSYSVGSYSTNLLYNENNNVKDGEGNFIPQKQIGSVSISEQLSPLIKLDVTWQSSLLSNFEIKKDRTLSLNFSNNQVMEVNGSEIVVGSGYRIADLELPIKMNKKKLKSDLNIKADVSLRNTRTVIRKIVDNQNQPTAGQRTIKISTTADYVISERLNIRLFYDHNISKPLTSSSFPTANTNAGISIRFTLSN